VYVVAATSYNGRFKSPGLEGLEPSKQAGEWMRLASGRSYESIRKMHYQDYHALYGRVDLALESKGTANIPTDKRIVNYAKDADPQMVALLFNYGRYLLISSSRHGGQAANFKVFGIIWYVHHGVLTIRPISTCK
jgi:alpha-L-fucosidase 2